MRGGIMVKFYVGLEIDTIRCGTLEIIDRQNNDYLVRFKDTGFEKLVKHRDLTCRKVKDPYAKVVVGVGFVGEGKYKPKVDGKMTSAYNTWWRILNRCYNINSGDYRFYGMQGVSVDPEWHCFQNFAGWFYENSFDNYHVDKDLLSADSKIYSRDTCCFLPQEINKALKTTCNRKDTAIPAGIRLMSNGSYQVQVSNTLVKKLEYLGTFPTLEQASVAYLKRKKEIVVALAEKYYGQQKLSDVAYNGLLRWEPKH
jgi:hypothetical protein